MTVQLDLQIVSTCTTIPTLSDLRTWANAAFASYGPCTLSVRIVDIPEMHILNRDYRHKDKPTNVLSFPMNDIPDVSPFPLVGDIVICAPIVAEEALQAQRPIIAHWAHLMIHGSLHLLGYDHEIPSDAVVMEKKEVIILSELGFPSPYGELTK